MDVDMRETKGKIKEELGLIPDMSLDDYEKNLEDVFSKLDKF